MDDNLPLALLTAASCYDSVDKYVLLTSNLYKAQKLYSSLQSLLGNDQVVLFPCDELIRAQTISSSKELMANRIYTLDYIQNKKPKVVITNLAAGLRYIPSPEEFKNAKTQIKVGDTISLKDFRTKLSNSGYLLVNKVDSSLQFAIRGDIIDVFSVNSNNPTRIELFGDEVESIREFDISTQKSINNLQIAIILPASEFLISDEELYEGIRKIRNQLDLDCKNLPSPLKDKLVINTDNDIAELLERNSEYNFYKYYGFLKCKNFSIFDYLSDYKCVLVSHENLKTNEEMLIRESHEYLYQLYTDGFNISHLQYYQTISEAICHCKKIIFTDQFLKSGEDISVSITEVPYSASKRDDSLKLIRSYLNEEYTICICLDNKEGINTISECLLAEKIPYEIGKEFTLPKKDKIIISCCSLPSGFCCAKEKIVFLTNKELFNEKIHVGRFDSRFKKASILSSYEDLEPGDYVVHEYQGIGRFVSLETIEVQGEKRDYLKIEYYNNELLFVPLTQFQLVRKYQGKEGASPRLSHLNSKDWENTKKKIKEKINDLAHRLFELYKERNSAIGYSFQEDDEFQEQFEKDFPYELTPDQKRTVDEIKKDMMAQKPMDRLVCGDVGFGKTEVAFEAIFKCILSGKQAAILCPTTLLARQHFERAVERFQKFDVKIAIFSRLITDKIQNIYIEEIAQGKIHLIIGTHRLLSKDIVFKDLGLLVVDEEQRFGVEQKEKIKELKSNVDVLTLSATPIPRTLQISLLGVRALSQINTAPTDRMPIQTYVMPFSFDVVKELIERELGREGQVFYLHNNISTLDSVANRIKKMIPDARVAVGHGKMSKEDIENVMNSFYTGQIDVLVCTSIIENGIDVPNANMIIVQDADHFGLSQLYQIKGRVGRGNRIGYAYLFFNANKVMNEDAQKRLKAIQDFTELGSGYKIAQRDLMIRGAGDILGPEQAGFIDSIGLDMYIKLLNEAVKEQIEGVKEEKISPTIRLSMNGYIPSEFANDQNKIELYQEIISKDTCESLSDFKKKTVDNYGRLPKEVEQIFQKRNIDILFKDISATDVKETLNFIEFNLGNQFLNIKGVGNLLFESLIPYLSLVKIGYINHKFRITLHKESNYVETLENVLQSLREILSHNQLIQENNN